jgi:hypothetical protein
MSQQNSEKNKRPAAPPAPTEGVPAGAFELSTLNYDPVMARTHLMVPKDMKCHKCGAEEPWRDPMREEVNKTLESLAAPLPDRAPAEGVGAQSLSCRAALLSSQPRAQGLAELDGIEKAVIQEITHFRGWQHEDFEQKLVGRIQQRFSEMRKTAALLSSRAAGEGSK